MPGWIQGGGFQKAARETVLGVLSVLGREESLVYCEPWNWLGKEVRLERSRVGNKAACGE